MIKPNEVNILGSTYTVTYVNNPVEVDMYKRQSLWGQIDFWTRTIRVYDNERPFSDIFHTILHEILHHIATSLHLEIAKEEHHDELDLLALALSDVFIRNDWLK